MADWADRQAAEIIKTVFARPDARDVIAAELRNLALTGARVGIRQAQQIMDDERAGRSIPPSETVARIINACGQM